MNQDYEPTNPELERRVRENLRRDYGMAEGDDLYTSMFHIRKQSERLAKLLEEKRRTFGSE